MGKQGSFVSCLGIVYVLCALAVVGMAIYFGIGLIFGFVHQVPCDPSPCQGPIDPP